MLRLELPRLAQVHAGTPVRFALVQGGAVSRAGELPLAQLALALPAIPAAAILHPADATLAHATLPPLPAHRLAAALAGTIEPLVLGDVDSLALAHGPRAASGATPVAWADRALLARAWSTLADAGVPVQALVPAPLALPLPGADEVVLMERDGALLLRSGLDEGATLLLGDGDAAARDTARAWLRLWWQRQPQARPVWVGAVPAWSEAPAPGLPAPSVRPFEARWSAELPAWSLAIAALRPRRLQASPWRRPLAWSAAAAAVWLLGLNVHAARLEGEQAALRAHMNATVRAAFPQLPVILDPVRQATQQRDALLAAGGEDTPDDFVLLARAGARLLPPGTQVERLQYQDGELAIFTAGEVAAALDPTIARRAAELAVEVDQRDGAWRLRPLASGVDAGGGVTVRTSPGARFGAGR